MSTPDRLTVTRIVLAPVFFLAYSISDWTGFLVAPSIVVLWIVFGAIELTDLLDGLVARRRDQVTEVGKLLDPFADVVARLTYFVCFAQAGFMPSWALLVVIYREVSIGFLRTLFSRRGVALAARSFGKIKAVVYSVASALAIFLLTMIRLGLFRGALETMVNVVRIGLMAAAVVSAASFVDYLFQYRRAVRQ